MHGALNVHHLLRAELAQRSESGYDVHAISKRVAKAGGIDSINAVTASALLDELAETTRPADWDTSEPEGLEAIQAAADWPEPVEYDVEGEEYASAVQRAWNGRVVGNMLGKPVENWAHEDIKSLLTRLGEWPLNAYFPWRENADEDLPPYVEDGALTTRGHIEGSARDDDVDYTILNLSVLREFGTEFTTAEVGMTWLERLPFLKTYTAERVALRNMIRGDAPGKASEWRNPYREFIGAAIRADIFGMIAPGDVGLAATLAYRDAVLSHSANGVYGEMFCAALVAAAFHANSGEGAVRAALRVVPKKSRLYGAITDVLGWHDQNLSWDQTREQIAQVYGHYSPVHTISNAAVLVAGLVYGAGDFDRTIGLTVMAGLDTDSNGATAGAVAGLLADAIDARWTDPLNDTVRSAVFGYDGISIKQLAEQTIEVALALGRGNPMIQPDWHHGEETW